MTSVLYSELTPREFTRRLKQAPIAYLPLGTLEWHGAHLPLGSDGLQSGGFFELLARKAGGIVLPMLFLGPDRKKTVPRSRVPAPGSFELYGMDIANHFGKGYPDQQLPGSAYHIPTRTYRTILEAILKQLKRAGFKIVMAHGHGPSTNHFIKWTPALEKKFGLKLFHCWVLPTTSPSTRLRAGDERPTTQPTVAARNLGLQTDHAATNETSLVMALRPELVKMKELPKNRKEWPLAVAGDDPRRYASATLGKKAIAVNLKVMAGILRAALRKL